MYQRKNDMHMANYSGPDGRINNFQKAEIGKVASSSRAIILRTKDNQFERINRFLFYVNFRLFGSSCLVEE